ncbi:unnamed protein product [Somion occarium]|uniref:Uncharacterized protein n=1 Tax=Somion occarium TaxID=3059160 RepID=A0ABP1DRM9_9APHY
MSTMNKEDLQSYFERSATIVLQIFDKVEAAYVRPGLNALIRSFQTKPLHSTFLSTFALLSFLPFVAFIGFSLFVLGSSLFFALATALAVSAAAITVFGFILAITLIILFFVSVFLTMAVLGSLLALRLIFLVRSNGPRGGVTEWAQETRSRVYAPKDLKSESVEPDVEEDEATSTPQAEEKDEDAQDEHEERSNSSMSVGSTVVVAGQEGKYDPDVNAKLEE